MTSVQSPRSSGNRSTARLREVDAQDVGFLAQQRRELVQQPGLGADPVVLHARAELRQLAQVLRRGVAGEGQQRERQRGLERGARGEPAPARQVAGEHEMRRPQLVARRLQLGDHPAVEVLPAPHPLRLGELVVLAEVERVDLPARRRRRGHRHPALDRERHRQPAVVVGVLADQVDPAGAERADHERLISGRERRPRHHLAASRLLTRSEAAGEPPARRAYAVPRCVYAWGGGTPTLVAAGARCVRGWCWRLVRRGRGPSVLVRWWRWRGRAVGVRDRRVWRVGVCSRSRPGRWRVASGCRRAAWARLRR